MDNKIIELRQAGVPADAEAAAEIRRLGEERAAEICGVYGIRGAAGEKAAASAIRKAIRLQFGAASAREIPRCEYGVAMDAAGKWDDYREMMKIKKRVQS